MHLDDVAQRRDRFKNEQIIFAHFSTRYQARQIRDFVDKQIPDLLGGRAHLWL
jgi:ribonuclease Z